MSRTSIYWLMSQVAVGLRSCRWLKNVIYFPLKSFLRPRLLTVDYALYLANLRRADPPLPEVSYCSAEGGPWIGIIRDRFNNHEAYIRACRKLRITYKMIDIFASDWIEQVTASGCDIFVAWPGECIQEWKRMHDERFRFLTQELGKKLYPSSDSLWLYGCKERQATWMKLHGIPHPKTWIFYDLDEAYAFLKNTAFPLVSKCDIGAASYGVRILHNAKQAQRLLKRVFTSGIVGFCADRQARQWRHILFQEYLQEIEEWRMVRIGDSYFGHLKGRGRNGLHSGSGTCEYRDPGKELLDLTKRVTDTGAFDSMALDIFRTQDGQLLVNECQAVFGCAVATTQTKIDGVPGIYLCMKDGLRFGAGDFCGNFMCDLRLANVLALVEKRENGGA